MFKQKYNYIYTVSHPLAELGNRAILSKATTHCRLVCARDRPPKGKGPHLISDTIIGFYFIQSLLHCNLPFFTFY